VTRKLIRRNRGEHAGIEWDYMPLGVVPDLMLAEYLGVNGRSVNRARESRGITTADRPGRHADNRFYVQGNGGRGYQRSPEWRSIVKSMIPVKSVPWNVFGHLLGSDYDSNVANNIGTTIKTVREHRYRRRIPAYKETRVCPCGDRFLAFHADQITCQKQQCLNKLSHHRHRCGYPDETLPIAFALSEITRELNTRRA